MAQAPAAAAGPSASPQQLNRQQRAMVLAAAVPMKQQIFSQTLTASQAAGQAPISIAPRNVGLVRKFIIEIAGTFNNLAGAAANITDIGLANLLSQVVFTDLQNNQRIQTTGWHLHFIKSAKHRWANAAALLETALIQAGVMGNNFGVIVAPTAVATGTSPAFRMVFEVPLAYSDEDLRGSVYMNVVNAVANLQLTINPAFMAANSTDSTSAVWKSTGATLTSSLSNVTVTVYQEYLDQLPRSKGIPILPALDLSTIYELKNTTFTGFVANNEFPIPYANFRDFLSTILIFNDNPAADAGRVGGTDVNYFAQQSANFTNLFKVDPLEQARLARELLMMDMPLGCYYFSSRKRPISTVNYGNMELIVNPITAAAGAYGLVGFEDFSLVNALTQAGSLAAS